MAGDLADNLVDEAWTEVTWNERSDKTFIGSFNSERNHVVSNAQNSQVDNETSWRLLQRDHGPDGDDLKAWICWELDDASLEPLVIRTFSGRPSNSPRVDHA